MTDQYTWSSLWLMVFISCGGLYVGLTTKPGPRDDANVGYIFRRYARTVGLLIGIGGWLVVFRLLMILLTRSQ